MITLSGWQAFQLVLAMAFLFIVGRWIWRTYRGLPTEQSRAPGATAEVITTTVVQQVSPSAPKCRSCKATATHPMPVTGYSSARDQKAGNLSVGDDPNRPNELCADHHRMQTHFLLEQIARGKAAAFLAEADTSRALALMEGGRGVEIMKQIGARVMVEDASVAAEQYRQFEKPAASQPELPPAPNGSLSKDPREFVQ